MLLKHGRTQPISKYHAVCLSYLIPHGSTDMFMFPLKQYGLNYGSSCAFFMFQPMRLKFLCLFMYSVFHMKNDIRGPIWMQLTYSVGVHLSWIWFPEWAISYLALIHTTLHYRGVLPFLNRAQLFSLGMAHVFIYILLQNYDTTKLTFGGTWIPLVIGHIMTNT